MPDLLSSLVALFNELRRRKVVRSIIMYGGGALGALAAAELVVDTYGLDESIRRAVGVIVLLGFPVAVILSWMFDWTSDGVVRAERHPLPPEVRKGAATALGIVALAGVAGAGLLMGIDAGDDPPPVPHITRPAPTVGILPLEGFGATEAAAWLAPAIATNLDAALTDGPIVLRSRDAVAAYHARGLPIDSLATVLDVEYFVTVRLAHWGPSDSVSVHVQLIDGRTSTVLGGGTVSSRGGDPVRLVSTLVTGVEAVLRRELGWETQLREWQAGTSDARAYQLRFRAEERREAARSLRTADPAAAHAQLLTADSLLRESQRADPGWVEAPLARADLAIDLDLSLTSLHGLARPELVEEALDAGIRHADDALAIEPGSPEALAVRGQLLHRKVRFAAGDPARRDSLLAAAEADLRAALRDEPHLTSAGIALSDLLFTHRQAYEEARAFALRALDTDAYLEGASRIIWRIAMASYELGDDDVALDWCREGLRRFPADPRHHSCLLDVMAWGDAAAQPDTAWRHLRAILDILPSQNRSGRDHYTTAVAAVLARAGMPDSARAVLRRVTDAAPRDATLHLESAVRFRLGEEDRARDLFQRLRETDPAAAQRLQASRMFRRFLDPPRG